MIVVTGAAGFIGSCIVAQLNARGRDDLILVDHMEDGKHPSNGSLDVKKENLAGKQYGHYYDKKEFLRLVQEDALTDDIECIIHMGACSSTTLQDAEYFKENNLEYTRYLAEWALKYDVRFIYASSAATYGDGSVGYSDDNETIAKCKPLNLYGQSKQDFDQWVLDNGLINKMVGLKFFNVYGPNEYHKKDMRSVVAKAYQKVVKEGKMQLFKSYKTEYSDGEQRRDFIYVKDAVEVVLFFMDNPQVSGIFNVGTGESRTWNDLAQALFKAVGKNANIEYVEMPDSLKPRYQYFTEAQMAKLREHGYTKDFTKLEDAIVDYVGYLEDNKYM